MLYYISRTLHGAAFDDAIERVTRALQAEGFGVITDIDVQATFKKKLNAEFRPYRILGACDPQMALQALNHEDKIGTMLPCNFIVQETANGIEIAAVDPVVAMSRSDNPALRDLAEAVRRRLSRAVQAA
jgi:uncharacterized protein (DUF302 family)